MFILFSLPTLVAIFFAIYFTRRHGSKAIFSSIGYLVLLIGVPLLILLLPFYIIGLPKVSGGLDVYIYVGLFSLFLILPGYIILAVLIYFFWPPHFEPTPLTPEEVRKFKRKAHIVLFSALIIYPALTFFVMSRMGRPDRSICWFDTTGECVKDQQLFLDNQRIGGLR